MKKVFLLLTLIATTFSAWGEFKDKEVWIAGTGTTGTSWSSNRLKLSKSGSVYTYTGFFYGITGNDGMKIPTAPNNNDTCIRPTSFVDVTSGGTYNLIRNKHASGQDYKFRVSQNGWYTFSIDMSTQQLTASKGFPTAIYPAGGCFQSNGNWKTLSAMNQTSAGSGIYEAYIQFYACTNKEIKFACMNGHDYTLIGSYSSYPNPVDTIKGPGEYNAKHWHKTAASGTSLNFNKDDNKFKVTLSSDAEYFVRVDLNLNSNKDNKFKITIKKKPTFTIDKTAVTCKVGSTITRAIETNSDGKKKYSSSNSTVAAVDDNGVVTMKAAGTATITAKLEESTTFGPMSDSYTVTVERNLPELAFAEASKTVCKNAAPFIIPLQNKGNGEVKYTSTGVADVDENTGMITIKGVGSATITATSKETDQYAAGSTTFNLTVSSNLTPYSPTPKEYTVKRTFGAVAEEMGFKNDANLSDTLLVINNVITVRLEKVGTMTLKRDSSRNAIRFYQKHTGYIKFQARPGVTIKSIKLDWTLWSQNGCLTAKDGGGKGISASEVITSGSAVAVNANSKKFWVGTTSSTNDDASIYITNFEIVYTADPNSVVDSYSLLTNQGSENEVTFKGDSSLYTWKVKNFQHKSTDNGDKVNDVLGIRVKYKGTTSEGYLAMDGNQEGGIKNISFDYNRWEKYPVRIIINQGSTALDNFYRPKLSTNDVPVVYNYTKDLNLKSNTAISIVNPKQENPQQTYVTVSPITITPYLLFNVPNHTASLNVKDGTTCDLNSALINNTGENKHTFSILENTAGGYPTITNGILDFSSVTESGYIKVQAKWGDVTTTLKINITPLPKQTMSFAESSKSVTVGAISSFTNTLTHSTGDGAISYESSNPSVASVASNGEVTIHAVGAAMIIAKAAKTANYQAAELSYPVTVSRVAHAIPLADITETKLVLDLGAENNWTTQECRTDFAYNNAITILSASGNAKPVNPSDSENKENPQYKHLRYYQSTNEGKMTFQAKSGVTIKSIYVDYNAVGDDGTVFATEYINGGVNVPSSKQFPIKSSTTVNANEYSLYTGSTSPTKTGARADVYSYSFVYNDPSIVFEQLLNYSSGISADVTGDNGLYKWSVNAVNRTESVGAYKGVKLQDANKSIAMLENQEGGIKSVSFDYKVLSTDAIGFNVTAAGVTDEYTHAGVTANRVLTYTHDFDAQNTSLKIELTAGKSAIAVGPIHITPYLLFNVEGHAVAIDLTSAADATSIDLMPLLINNTGTVPTFTMLDYTTGGTPSVSDAGVVDFSSVTKTGTIKVRANVGNVSTTLTLNIDLLDANAKFDKETDAIYTTAGTYQQTLGKGSSTGKVTYDLTSAPAGAAINKTTGEVTISTTAGDYTVQGKLAAALPYAEAVKTYTLTVTEPPIPTTNFAPTTVNKNQLDDPFTNELTTQSDGKKHFTSTDTRVATVNDSTGEVTMGEKPGTTKIKVVIDATKSWKEGSAEYTLNVSGAPVADAHVLTISTDDLKKKHGFENDKNYTNIALNDVLTLSSGKYYTNSGGILRYYQKYDPKFFTIQAKAGVIIQSVRFTYISQNNGTLAKSNTTSVAVADRYESGKTYAVDANSFTCYFGNTSTGTDGRAEVTKFEITYFDPSEGVAVTKMVNDLGKSEGLVNNTSYKKIAVNNAISLETKDDGTLKYYTSGVLNCYRHKGAIEIKARPGATIHHVKITYTGTQGCLLTKYKGTGYSILPVDQIASDSILYVNANSIKLDVGTSQASVTDWPSISITKIYVNYTDTTSVTETFETTPAAGWTLSNCTTGNERIYYDQAVKLNTTNGKISTTVAEGGIKDLSFDWSPVSTGKKVDFKVNCNSTADAITQASYDKNYVFTYTKTGVKSNNVSFSIEQQSTSATEIKISRIAITPYLLYTEKEADITVCSSYKNTNLIDNRDNATAIVYSVTKGSEYASVNTSTGEVTGLKAGTATIQAAWDGVTTTYQLTVSTESSITLDEEKDNSLLIAGYDGVENMTVTLIRKLSAGKYNTFCVPFTICKDTLAKVLDTEITQLITLDESQPGALEEEGGQMNLNIAMKEVDTVKAGKPYLLEIAEEKVNPTFPNVTIEDVGEDNFFKSSEEAVKFYGITSPHEIPWSNKYLFMSNNRLSWNNSGAAAYMKGLRSYFHATNGGSGVAARLVFNQPSTPTEVENVNANANANRKMIINNQLIIIREGVRYNVMGAKL